MINESYIDGGITYVDGQYKRIVLDALGRFSHLEEPRKGAGMRSSMDIASEEAKNKIPVALTLEPTPESLAAAQLMTAPAQLLTAPVSSPASGFKAPM